jgi:hypothetical protein
VFAGSGRSEVEQRDLATGLADEVEDNGLRTALQRLTLSLDRIHALLDELHAGTSPGREPRAAPSVCSCTTATGPSPERKQPMTEVAGGAPLESWVIYGGGPSAFISR